MEPTELRDEDWAMIEAQLPSNWRELAREHGILTKVGGTGSGWKMRDPSALLRMILHYVCTGSALVTTTATAAAMGVADISGVALHKWMRKSGPWLAAMLSEMVSAASQFAPSRWAGYEVIVADATTVEPPGAVGTTARVHLALRLVDLKAVAIKVTDAHVGESLRNFAPAAEQLWLADRGYANANSIAHATAGGAAVVVRYSFGTLPLFDAAGAALEVRTLVHGLGASGSVAEWPAWVEPKKGKRIEGRLIAIRLPPHAVERSRARLRQQYSKREITPLMLEATQYVVLFTTVPSARLDAATLIELYRLRWQVELHFKRDKSIGGLDKLPSRVPETIHAWICAKLLGLRLARKLAEPGEPFPPSIVGAYALRPRLKHFAARPTARPGE